MAPSEAEKGRVSQGMILVGRMLPQVVTTLKTATGTKHTSQTKRGQGTEIMEAHLNNTKKRSDPSSYPQSRHSDYRYGDGSRFRDTELRDPPRRSRDDENHRFQHDQRCV